MSEPKMETNKPNSYETGLERLKEIVLALGAGDLALEESLRLFEEGTKLTRELNDTLNQAERTVKTLIESSSEGVRTEPFDSAKADRE